MEHVSNERKSSYSSGSNGNCVAVGTMDAAVSVRDTTQRHLPDDERDMMTTTASAWSDFLARIKARLETSTKRTQRT
jgi:hypothetical protein